MERFGVSMARLTGEKSGEVKSVAKPAGLQADEDDGDDDEMDEEEVKTTAQNASAAPAPATANRWAALRGYISATMEQNPAFSGKK